MPSHKGFHWCSCAFPWERSFKVDQFKTGKPIGPDQCDLGDPTEVPDFTESAFTAGHILHVHSPTANGNGCYQVTLEFNDGCRVDPHIIVRGGNLEAIEAAFEKSFKSYGPPSKGGQVS